MGRRLTILLAVAAAAVLVPLSAPDDAAALSCAYQSPEEKFQRAEAAIVASVVEATSGPPPGGLMSSEIRFRVLEVHKGTQFRVGGELTVSASIWGDPPKPGTEMAVLLRYIDDPGWGIWFSDLACGSISIGDLRRVSAEANSDQYRPRHPICVCAPFPPRARVSFHWLGGKWLPLRSTLAGGGRFVLGCPAGCRYSIRLWLSAHSARQLGLGKGREPVVVARAIGRLAGGQRRALPMRFTKQARNRLAGQRRVKVTVRGTIAPGPARIRGVLMLTAGAH